MDKTTPKQIKVSLYTMMIVVSNVVRAWRTKEIGYVECNTTIREFMRELNKNIYVPTSLLERGLYYCVMLSERQSGRAGFWHPSKTSLDTFLQQILPSELEYNKLYNVIGVKQRGKDDRKIHE
jgi:hypothetical protein